MSVEGTCLNVCGGDIRMSWRGCACLSVEGTCLYVRGGVPVGVVEQHAVGPGEVDAEAADACGEEEAEDALVPVELVHQPLRLTTPRLS